MEVELGRNKGGVSAIDSIAQQAKLLKDSLLQSAVTLGVKASVIKVQLLELSREIRVASTSLGRQKDRSDVVSHVLSVFQMLVLLPLVLGALGLVLTGLCRIKCTAFLLHLSWIIGYILLLAYFLLTVFVFYLGAVNQKTCNLLTVIKNDPSSLSGLIPNRTQQELLDIVLNKPAQLVDSLNISSDLAPLLAMNESYSSLAHSRPSAGASLEQLQHLQRAMLNPFKAMRSALPLETLRQLNSWTDYNVHMIASNQIQQGDCLVSQDVYVYEKETCTRYPKYMIYAPNTPLFGQKVCIPLESLSDPQFGKNRYGPDRFKTCRPLNGKYRSVGQVAQAYFTGLFDFKKGALDLLGNLTSQITTFRKKEKEMQDRLLAVQKETKSKRKEVEPLLTQAMGPQGLVHQLEWTFVNEDFLNLKDSLCVTHLNGLFYNFIFLVGCCVWLFLFSLLMCFASTRLIPRRDDQVYLFHQEEQPHEIKHSHLF